MHLRVESGSWSGCVPEVDVAFAGASVNVAEARIACCVGPVTFANGWHDQAPKDMGATEATVAADSLRPHEWPISLRTYLRYGRPLHDEELSFEDEEAFEGPGAQRAKAGPKPGFRQIWLRKPPCCAKEGAVKRLPPFRSQEVGNLVFKLGDMEALQQELTSPA